MGNVMRHWEAAFEMQIERGVVDMRTREFGEKERNV
jgi:hypothetical protein